MPRVHDDAAATAAPVEPAVPGAAFVPHSAATPPVAAPEPAPPAATAFSTPPARRGQRKRSLSRSRKSRRRRAAAAPGPAATAPAPVPDAEPAGEASEAEYEVERVCGVRVARNGELWFEIKWKGWPESANSWEHALQLGCPAKVGLFFSALERARKRPSSGADGGHLAKRARVEGDGHDDCCFRCGRAGELLCCDTCERAVHCACATPRLRRMPGPDEPWRCFVCELPRYETARAELARAYAAAAAPSAPPGEADRAAAGMLLRYGVCETPYELGVERAGRVRGAVWTVFGRLMDTVKRRDLLDKLLEVGFTDFKVRCEGRYDVRLWPQGRSLTDARELDAERAEIESLLRDAPWLPMVRHALGGDCKLLVVGSIVAMPGSADQPAHSDGDHISKTHHRPPHCVNVFVPLDDFSVRNGATQFWPASHFRSNFDSRETCTPTPSAGHCVAMDYRVRHRGRKNTTARPRLMLYATYSRPSFEDQHNFSQRRYLATPALLPLPRSRGERGRAPGDGS